MYRVTITVTPVMQSEHLSYDLSLGGTNPYASDWVKAGRYGSLADVLNAFPRPLRAGVVQEMIKTSRKHRAFTFRLVDALG